MHVVDLDSSCGKRDRAAVKFRAEGDDASRTAITRSELHNTNFSILYRTLDLRRKDVPGLPDGQAGVGERHMVLDLSSYVARVYTACTLD